MSACARTAPTRVSAGREGWSAPALSFWGGEIPLHMMVVTCVQGACSARACMVPLSYVCMNFVSLK